MFSCYYDGTGYVCSCPAPYTGRRCESNINSNFKDEFQYFIEMFFAAGGGGGGVGTCAANPNYCKNGGR